MPDSVNTASLNAFHDFVIAQKATLLRQYGRAINQDLARQRAAGLMQRNVERVMQQCYEQALQKLGRLTFDHGDCGQPTGLPKLVENALHPFDGMFDDFLTGVIQHHRSSCALSNFPEEHAPSAEYVATIVATAEQQWQAFTRDVHYCLTGNENKGA